MSSERFSFPPLVHRCLFLSGPTASGKTSVALELADRLNAEILSLDSIAVYRGMDVGTAKPSTEERERVKHHLLDIADPWQDFSISNYLAAAHQAVAEIETRQRKPLFVGGTPLYLKALLRGFYAGPPPDWNFRQSIEADVQQFGNEALHARLTQVDPLTAHRLAKNDIRRITRALEVAFLTGTPLSHLQMQFENPVPAEECSVFALNVPREKLGPRIDRRVDKMFAAGLVAEVEKLLKQASAIKQSLSRTAAQAVGYRETIAYLQGEASLAETIDSIKLHTRQLSKRQQTWLRSLCEVTPIDTAEPPSIDAIVRQIQLAID